MLGMTLGVNAWQDNAEGLITTAEFSNLIGARDDIFLTLQKYGIDPATATVKNGVGLIAARSGADVLPVCIKSIRTMPWNVPTRSSSAGSIIWRSIPSNKVVI